MEKNKTDSTPVKDIALRFPNAVLLKASAGSGKTRALSPLRPIPPVRRCRQERPGQYPGHHLHQKCRPGDENPDPEPARENFKKRRVEIRKKIEKG